MSDKTFEAGGRSFQLNKINALKQFHITRRIAPILAELMPALGDMQKASQGNEADNFDALAKVATPIMTGLSRLSDKDADWVLMSLLASVEMQQPGGGWARVASDTMIMFQDLELPLLLQIAGRAFMFNLSGFFAALPQK